MISSRMFSYKCCESWSLLYQLNPGPLHESKPRVVSKRRRVSLGRGSEALGCVSVHYGDRSWNWSRAGGTWRTRICKHLNKTRMEFYGVKLEWVLRWDEIWSLGHRGGKSINKCNQTTSKLFLEKRNDNSFWFTTGSLAISH